MRSSFISGELNEISLSRLRISDAERGVSGRSRGLICTRMVSWASLSRIRGVMVGLPANPPSQYASPSMTIAWNIVGRQADASSTSGVISGLRKMCPRPVRTFVAVMNSLIGDPARRLKSMLSARSPRRGLSPVGLRS